MLSQRAIQNIGCISLMPFLLRWLVSDRLQYAIPGICPLGAE